MKNRAKCKLCGDIIESLHRHDYVKCSCDEIAIDGGNDYCRAFAKDWTNFIRIDDDGNEIPVTLKEPDVKEPNNKLSGNSGQLDENVTKPNKEELIDMLDEMVKNIENLPPAAMTMPITHYDLASLMMLLSSIFKEKE